MREMGPGILLRPAERDDLAAVEQLLTASGLPLAGVGEAFANFVVAEHVGRIIGVTGLERRAQYGLLRSAAVASEWRGRAVGAALVERVIHDANQNGVQAIYLLTTTAERYFPSFGFSVVERATVPEEIRNTVEFVDACPASAVVMERRL